MRKRVNILLLFVVFCVLFPARIYAQTVNLPTSGAATANACGNNITVYDNGGSGSNYSNSVSGYIVLNCSGSAVITISGSYNTESGYDYVYIYSGSGTGGSLLASYNGSGTINYTGAAGQTLTIQLSSDGSINYSGIALNVTYSGACAAAPSTLNIPASGSNTVTCGTNTTLYLDAGNTNYSDGDNGFTVLSCSGSGQISISGSYNTESSYDYIYIYIYIYSGAGTGGTLLYTYNGSGTITNYTAPVGQTITIKFTSDGSVNYSGNVINVNYITSCCTPPVVAAIAGGASTICLGTPSPAFTDATAGGTWSINNGTGAANINTSTGVVTGLTVGTATVSYAVTSGGCTTTNTYGFTVSDVVYVAAIGGGLLQYVQALQLRHLQTLLLVEHGLLLTERALQL